MPKFSIKVIYGNEIRRFPYPLTTSTNGDQFATFVDLLTQTFAIPTSSTVKFTYKDDEDEEITLASQMELDEAFSVIEPLTILRLHMIMVTSTSPTETNTLDSIATWKLELQKNKVLYEKQLIELKENHHLTDIPEAVLVKQLTMSNGSVDFVLAKQQKRKECQQQRQQKLQQIRDQYPTQVNALQEMGYSMEPPVCLWLLKKHDGDLLKVIDSVSNTNTTGKKLNRTQIKQKYAAQLQQLRELGFNGPGAVWQLNKCDGDVSLVVAKRLKKLNYTRLLTTKYAEQLRYLAAKGYSHLPVNLRLLNKFDGDISKVESKLEQRKNYKCNTNYNAHYCRFARRQL